MIIRVRRKAEVRSLVAMLAIALGFVPGCGQDESATQAPPNPSPRGDLGGVKKDILNAEKDLSKDLKPPVIKPGGEAAPPPPPAGKTGTP